MTYVCYADPNPDYYPAMRLIAAITNGNPAVITTTFAHGYGTGIIVRIVVPKADGMEQINGMTGTITVTGDTTFTIDIDTTYFEAFAIPGVYPPHTDICALVIPIGEVNETLLYASRNVAP